MTADHSLSRYWRLLPTHDAPPLLSVLLASSVPLCFACSSALLPLPLLPAPLLLLAWPPCSPPSTTSASRHLPRRDAECQLTVQMLLACTREGTAHLSLRCLSCLLSAAPEPLGPPCTSPPLSSSLDVSKPRIRVAPEARGFPITPALSPTAALSSPSPPASNTATSFSSPDAEPPGHAPAPASSTACASTSEPSKTL